MRVVFELSYAGETTSSFFGQTEWRGIPLRSVLMRALIVEPPTTRERTKPRTTTHHSVWPHRPCEQRTTFTKTTAVTKTHGHDRPNGTPKSQESTVTRERLFRQPRSLAGPRFRLAGPRLRDNVSLFRFPPLLRGDEQLFRPNGMEGHSVAFCAYEGTHCRTTHHSRAHTKPNNNPPFRLATPPFRKSNRIYETGRRNENPGP